MGCVWVMVTSPLGSPARTRLPNSTCFNPKRPEIGATTRVYSKLSLAESTKA